MEHGLSRDRHTELRPRGRGQGRGNNFAAAMRAPVRGLDRTLQLRLRLVPARPGRG